MQPNDQEELRRRAQEAMTRRRPAEAESTAQTEESASERPVSPRPVETPRPQRSRQNPPQRPLPRQSAERQTPQRPRQLTRRSAEERPTPERLEIPDTRVADEARARAERRRIANNAAPAVERHAAYRTSSSQQVQQLRRTLQNKHQIRQAILLNEILSPPVALRKQNDSGF